MAGLLLVVAATLAVAGSGRSTAIAATGVTTVGGTVVSGSSLDTTGCPIGSATQLGTLYPGTTTISSAACLVNFGSSNDTSSLRVYQRDGTGSAMTLQTPSFVTRAGSGGYSAMAAQSASQLWLGGQSAAGAQLLVTSGDGGATTTAETGCAGSTIIRGIAVVATDTLVALGAGNRICRSVNAGVTWTTVSSATGNWNGLSCVGTACWAVARNGIWGLSTDSGVTWSTSTLAQLDYLRGISAVSATEAYAVGNGPGATTQDHDIWHTTDGGVTWNKTVLIAAVSTTRILYRVEAAANGTILVADTAGIYRSTDGVTWTQVSSLAADTVRSLGGGVWLTANLANLIRRSADDGVTWVQENVPSLSTSSVRQFVGPIGGSVYASGGNQLLLRSTDNGLTFSPASPVIPDYHGVAAWTTSTYVAVGEVGTIARTTDGGSTFTTIPVSPSTTLSFQGVVALPDGVGVAVGNGGLIARSTDQGATWGQVSSGTGNTLQSITWNRATGVLWAVGQSGQAMKSTDEGLTWTAVTPPSGQTLIAVATTHDGSAVYAVSSAVDAVYRTTNGGASWMTTSTGTGLGDTGVTVTGSGAILVASLADGSGTSYVERSTNAGASWTQVTTRSNDFGTIRTAGGSRVYAVVGSIVIRSDDDGVTWSSAGTVATANLLLDFAPVDFSTLVAVGQSSTVITSVPTSSFADEAYPGTALGGAASVFGACLETATGFSSTTWTTAGSGACTAANGANWYGIATSTAGTSARIGFAPSGGTATAALRFGLSVGMSQPPGNYGATLVFDAIAPGV